MIYTRGDMQNHSILKFLLKSSKMRRLLILVGLAVSFIFVLKMAYNKLCEADIGVLEYLNGDMMTYGDRKSPKDLPGYFMRGKFPENGSYCHFNYGLPKKLKWNKVTVTGTPQLGKKSPYRVIYNAIERTMFETPYVLDQVTYATHVTPEFIYHVVEIARFWDGPISVAAFVPDYDLEITMKLFSQLCKCYDGMSKVSLHLVFPQHDRPRFLRSEEKYVLKKMKKKALSKEIQQLIATDETPEGNSSDIKISNATKEENFTAVTRTIDLTKKIALETRRKERELLLWFHDCSMPDMSQMKTFRYKHGLIYPVNVARNVAKNASDTQYNLVSDVEMIPSEGLATKFTSMLKRQKISGKYGVIPKWRLAFVIPVFEVESGEDVPRNKSSLQQLYSEGKVVYFHRWVCSHCQKIPDLQTWIKEDPGEIIKPFAITKRQFPYHRWEPIYIGTKHTPWYSETLSWEGRQDKMTQMLEMCLKSYDFVIVNGAFLCHSPGIKAKTKHKSWRYRHELVNTKQYDLIVKGLAERYPANPKCKLE